MSVRPIAARLPAMGADENDLLDRSRHRDQWPRLSCQVAFRTGLDMPKLRISKAD